MEEALRVRVQGPLARYTPELSTYLAGPDYADTSAAAHVRRLALVSAWLEKERLDPSDVDETLIAEIDATRPPAAFVAIQSSGRWS